MPPVDYPEINRRYFPFAPGTQTVQVTSLINQSLWSKAAQNRLIELGKLPDNWNGYGSPKISAEVIGECLSLLSEVAKLGMPKPAIIPVSGGGLQVEWRNAANELEIEILPDKTMHFLITDCDLEMYEGSINNNNNLAEFTPLTCWFLKEEKSILDLSVYARAY